MKRFLAIVLTLCMLISMSAIFVSADAIHEDDEATLVVASGEDDYGLPPENIFPFIYSLAPDWKFFREYVGVCNCKEGYLYAKNTDTNVITQLYADPVVAFAEANTNLYFITLDNKILRADYAGKNLTTIYSGGTNDITHVDYHNNKLFFAEGAAIRELNLSTMVVTDLTEVENIFSLDVVDSNTLVMRTEQAEKLVYEKQTDTITVLYGETGLIDYLDARSTVQATVATNASVSPRSSNLQLIVGQNDIQFPLAAYPAGSYYSTRSGGCDHDTYGNLHCRFYASAYQCMGFAMYASDQFAHLPYTTSFRRPSGDWEDCTYTQNNTLYYLHITQPSEYRVLFSGMTRGAYVRLSASSAATDVYDRGTHSVVYVDANTQSVRTYDANRNGNCDVQLAWRTFSDMKTYYPYVYEYVSHHYSENASQHTTLLHKYVCRNCAGYVTGQHTFVQNANGQFVCSECQYIMNTPLA